MYIAPELRENIHDTILDGLDILSRDSLPCIQYSIMYLLNRHIERMDNPTSVIGALKIIEAEIYRNHIKPVLKQDRFDNGEI